MSQLAESSEMHYLSGLLLIYGAVTLGLMSPGPNILSVIGASMSVGRGAGVALALGVAVGSLLWATFAAMGLAALLAAYASLLVAIKIAGGIYLPMARAEGVARRFLLRRRRSRPAVAARGAVALFPARPRRADDESQGRLHLDRDHLARDRARRAGFGTRGDHSRSGLLSLLGHLGYALAFSTRRVVQLYRRARRWIELALGAFFCFAGARLLTSRP